MIAIIKRKTAINWPVSNRCNRKNGINVRKKREAIEMAGGRETESPFYEKAGRYLHAGIAENMVFPVPDFYTFIPSNICFSHLNPRKINASGGF